MSALDKSRQSLATTVRPPGGRASSRDAKSSGVSRSEGRQRPARSRVRGPEWTRAISNLKFKISKGRQRAARRDTHRTGPAAGGGAIRQWQWGRQRQRRHADRCLEFVDGRLVGDGTAQRSEAGAGLTSSFPRRRGSRAMTSPFRNGILDVPVAAGALFGGRGAAAGGVRCP